MDETEKLCLSVFKAHLKYSEAIYLGPSKEFNFLITTKHSTEPWLWIPSRDNRYGIVSMTKKEDHIIIVFKEDTDITGLNIAVYGIFKRLVYYDVKRDILIVY